VSGLVTVVGTQSFEELRFQTDGYLLQPFDPAARLATTGLASTVDVSAGLMADIGVIVSGAGLTKTGAGTLQLSAVNTYTGATTVNAGTLRIAVDNAITNLSALDIAAGATFDLNGFRTASASLSGAGAVTLNGGRLDTGNTTVRRPSAGRSPATASSPRSAAARSRWRELSTCRLRVGPTTSSRSTPARSTSPARAASRPISCRTSPRLSTAARSPPT
jgi:autotransporter-associated beta strand protein